MRGCLSFLVFVAVLVAALAWVGLRPIASGVVDVGLATAGLSGRDRHVDVQADPPFALLTGHADRVTVRSEDAAFRAVRAGSLSLTFSDVAILDRTAASVRGVLVGVTAPDDSGQPVAIERIDLDGPLASAGARIRVAQSVVVARAVAALASAGVPSPTVRLLAPGTVVVGALGRELRAGLVVDAAGDVALSLPGLGTVGLMHPPAALAVRFSAASVDTDGSLVVDGTIDLRPLLAG